MSSRVSRIQHHLCFVEINADILLKGTKVNGVYSSDPLKDKKARLFKNLKYMELIRRNLKIMDSTAITLCMENKLPIIVFNFLKESSLKGIIFGEKIGTYIT